MKPTALCLALVGMTTFAKAADNPTPVVFSLSFIKVVPGSSLALPGVTRTDADDLVTLSKSNVMIANVKSLVTMPGGFTTLRMEGPNGISTMTPPPGTTAARIGLYLGTSDFKPGVYRYQVTVMDATGASLYKKGLSLTLTK